MRHALVNCRVGFDVHKITNFEDGKVSGHVREAMAPERLLEQIARLSSVAVGMWH
jgi:hypothetical protein